MKTDKELRNDKEFQAKVKHFQDQFLKLFEVHKGLMTGDNEEAKSYQAYMERLGAIQYDESLSDDARDEMLVGEQEVGAMSFAAEELAGNDDDLFENLFEAMSRVELTTASVNVVNNRPKKSRARKPRAAAAA